jgi:hypothetical protein
MLADGDARVAGPLRALMLGWNGFGPLAPDLPPPAPWEALCLAWRDGLATQPDLTTQLLGLVAEML